MLTESRFVVGQGPVDENLHNPVSADRARDDAATWAAMRAGSREAWGRLFDAHARAVYRFCLRTLGAEQDAEDAVAQTFLEAWRAREAFQIIDGDAMPALITIARRVCQKRQRFLERDRRKVGLVGRGRPREIQPDIADELVQQVDHAARQCWLRSQVQKLPDRQREVYELVIYAEMPLEQAAAALGVPVGTVKSRLSRARVALSDAADRSGLRALPIESKEQ